MIFNKMRVSPFLLQTDTFPGRAYVFFIVTKGPWPLTVTLVKKKSFPEATVTSTAGRSILTSFNTAHVPLRGPVGKLNSDKIKSSERYNESSSFSNNLMKRESFRALRGDGRK